MKRVELVYPSRHSYFMGLSIFFFSLLFFIYLFSPGVIHPISTHLSTTFVYPNPTRGKEIPILHVESKEWETVLVQIYDSAGELLIQKRLDENSNTLKNDPLVYEQKLDTPHLSSGIYVAIVTHFKNGARAGKSKIPFTVIR